MTRIEDFSDSTQEMVGRHIDEPFPDAIPVLESWFHGLTRSQLIFFEQYWREYGTARAPERETWEAIKWARERQKAEKRPSVRRETVVIKGHRVFVWRDPSTGRFVRRRRRR
jgi:hypothetical protein